MGKFRVPTAKREEKKKKRREPYGLSALFLFVLLVYCFISVGRLSPGTWLQSEYKPLH